MSEPSNFLKSIAPKLVTWSFVAVAAISALLLYNRWTLEPWTRNGQVRANIIQIAPQVNGQVVNVAVTDNSFVRAGELLFEIDRSSYQLSLDKAEVSIDQSRDEVASLEASVGVSAARFEEAQAARATAKRNISAAQEQIKIAQANIEQANAGIISAQQLIKQRQAELDNARSEAARAKRLLAKKAGSIETAESTAAKSTAKEAELANAQAGLTQAELKLTQMKASYSGAKINLLIAQDSLTEAKAAEASAKASLDQAKATLGKPGDDNVRVRTAIVSRSQAELELNRTRVVAPCDGYVSNLAIDEGTYAVAGQPLLVLVSKESFRVHAYFQETKLRNIQEGDEAIVTLMSNPNQKLRGQVKTIGYAVNPPNIAPTEGQPGQVPQIQPTFDWVRLPQRVPVTIQLLNVPEEIQLISGTTASVAVYPSDEE
ncbi:HlyD family secretion protein [Gimesia sp.]|uniref:HlyD family secretion protein n=1 Tax=Gimesia sp. TaxID=2024833 RepID=UPI0032ECB8BA